MTQKFYNRKQNQRFRNKLKQQLVLVFLLLSAFTFAQKNEVKSANPISLNDSIISAQLDLVESYKSNRSQAADSILNQLFLYNISGELLERAIYLKWINYSWVGKHKEAIAFLEQKLHVAEDKGRIYLKIANEYDLLSDYSKAITSTQEAILIFEQNNDLEGIVDANNSLIETYSEIGMHEYSRELFNANLKLCNKINYTEGLVTTYAQYGESLVFTNPDLAFEHIQKSVEMSKASNHDLRCSVFIVLTRFYINTNQYSKAKQIIKKYFSTCESKNDLRDGNVNTLMAHVYSLENNVDSTIYYNEKALKARLSNGGFKMIANSYLNLAGNYLAIRKFEKANEYLDLASEIINVDQNPEMILIYYSGKKKYYEAINDLENAFKFSEKEIEVNKQIVNKRYQSVLSKLNANFDIQKRNILLENELKDRKEKTHLLLFILLTLLIISVTTYLFVLYRKKKISYSQLASQTKNIERKLIISDKERLKLQSVFEFSVTGILILDREGIIQYANTKSHELLVDQSDRKITRIHFEDFFEDKEKLKVRDTLLKVIMENSPDRGLKVKIMSQKRMRWLDISFAPLEFKQEEENILVTLIDVTQEVINIGREKEQKQELQTLINSVTESILFLQRNGKIKILNNTAAKRLNLAPDKAVGLNYFDLLPKPLVINRMEMFDKVIQSKMPSIELEMIGNFNHLLSMYPNINEDGEVDYISEFVQDITERRLAEEQIDNLKQRVLRSQMNPHFIFNSLTSIQSFVLRSDATMASKYLNSFAGLIRLILESSRYDYITLKNEINILNYYLEIQKMRYSDNFTYSFDIDAELDIEKIKVPPMLAQPFIENSIEHGIQHLESIGELSIRISREDANLLFEIRDNGIGRQASVQLNQENIFASKSMSTKITNDRINSLNKYAKNMISYNIIDLKDETNKASGTLVMISIPIDN